ncbi:MAG: hypothetical protein KIS85_00430 [Anaerolineales bacterium]|nr:hypothetical protein [Anaerolineales bacterium]
MAGYFIDKPYASNRFSLTLFSGISLLFGLHSLKFITLLAVSFLFGSSYAILRFFVKTSLVSFSWITAALLAGALSFFSIYLAPQLYQSFYWQAAFLPYTAPLMFMLFLLALILYQSLKPQIPAWMYVIVSLIAFFGGGFSESGSAVLVSLLSMALASAYLNREKQTWARRATGLLGLALLFALSAMTVLIISPGILERASRYGEPASFAVFVPLLLKYSWGFIQSSLSSFPIPFSVLVAFSFSLAVVNPQPNQKTANSKPLLILVGILLLSFLLVAASYAPSAYIEKNVPAPRTRILSMYFLNSGLVAASFVIGHAVRSAARRWARPLGAFAAILLLLCTAYALRATGLTWQSKQPLYQQRAAIWDERHAHILTSREAGIAIVDVRGIDSLPVGGVLDLREKEHFWVNACAANYYGVEGIRAVVP